ncbi:gamma-interferon-responsive lysosomal thiol protein-like [Primulina tabacum]|uniref:gamma-interferon-responsive lysosomal thiol protein-like n=1 Tax=Primulina tabacum TaxID=48773 RepID=UPI003F5A5320
MDALRLLFVSFMITASFSSGSASKVKLELYYESLCPYCSNLIVNYLYEVFESDIASITDLKLIPYGNAKISPNGTIICQHGINECILNTVEACAIDAWPDVKDHFPFIYCVESLVYHKNYTHWETCFQKLNLDSSAVASCYVSERGKELELAYAAETSALQPPHKYVPWVTVDGQPLYDDYRNFISYICNAYKGTTKPSACGESSMRRSIRKVMMDSMASLYTEVTYKSKMSQIRQYILKWLDQLIQ